MMQVILTMMTNDNDSVVHDYGDAGNAGYDEDAPSKKGRKACEVLSRSPYTGVAWIR